MAGPIILLDEPVDYFPQTDRLQAIISRTLPNRERIFVSEYALTPHSAIGSLYGENGKVQATQQLLNKLGMPLARINLKMRRADAERWLQAAQDALKGTNEDVVTLKLY